jgi:AcrR family transcriptional regulator
MTDKKRPYRKTRRAELEEATRRRITESAVSLHATLGPARTSLSAIAAHAGVRRSTLYRHFADEAAVFEACTAHWMAANPVPDIGRWAAIADPDERARVALNELYPYYRRTEQMLTNLFRDEQTMPLVAQLFAGFRRYLAGAHDILMSGRELRGATRLQVSAATGHAIAFTTWKSLAIEQGLDDRQVADLMCRLIHASALRQTLATEPAEATTVTTSMVTLANAADRPPASRRRGGVAASSAPEGG